MSKLWAKVRYVTGKTMHLIGAPHPVAVEDAKIADPVAVEIVEEEGAFYLLRLNEAGDCIADTWHESLESAKAQAEFEFSVQSGDWKCRRGDGA